MFSPYRPVDQGKVTDLKEELKRWKLKMTGLKDDPDGNKSEKLNEDVRVIDMVELPNDRGSRSAPKIIQTAFELKSAELEKVKSVVKIAAICAAAVVFSALFLFFIVSIVALLQYPSFSVASASVSAFNVSASSISGKWEISFDIHNLRASPYTYEDVRISLYYKKTKLSQTCIMAFNLGAKNRTTLKTTFMVNGGYVDQSITNALNAERAASGLVYFTVKFLSDFHYKVWWEEKYGSFDMECKKISVAFPENSNNGTLVGGSKGCMRY